MSGKKYKQILIEYVKGFPEDISFEDAMHKLIQKMKELSEDK